MKGKRLKCNVCKTEKLGSLMDKKNGLYYCHPCYSRKRTAERARIKPGAIQQKHELKAIVIPPKSKDITE